MDQESIDDRKEKLTQNKLIMNKFEKEMAETLMGGDMQEADSRQSVPKNLISPYEIRIQAKLEPIVEETKWIRKIVKEVDNRYDKYDRTVGKAIEVTKPVTEAEDREHS